MNKFKKPLNNSIIYILVAFTFSALLAYPISMLVIKLSLRIISTVLNEPNFINTKIGILYEDLAQLIIFILIFTAYLLHRFRRN